MIRREVIFIMVLVSFLFTEGNAQSSHIDTLPASSVSPSSTVTSYHIVSLPLHKLHVGVQVGTEFMTTSGYGSGLSTFLSPTLTYPVSKRFVLTGGISVVNTTLYGVKPYYSLTGENAAPGFSGNITQTTLWVSGQYLLSDRITLTGTAYKTIDVWRDTPKYNPFYKNNPEGAYLNVGYKINDFMHIEAGFGYSKGYYGSSFGNPYDQGFGSSNYNPFFNR
jgi:hypothetical protein